MVSPWSGGRKQPGTCKAVFVDAGAERQYASATQSLTTMVEPQLFPGQGGTPHDTHRNVGAPSPMLQGMREQVTETASRLSVLEERVGNLRKKTQLTEQSLLEYERDTKTDLRALSERLTELARKVEDVREKIGAMTGELGTVVKKHEFTVLERYMDMWEPMSFVTRNEAKMLLQDAKGKK